MKLRQLTTAFLAALALSFATGQATAQVNLSRLLQGGVKAFQAITLSNDQIIGYVTEYINYSDSVNQVLPATNPYSQRLAKLTQGITSVEGIPLNFKVYKNDEVNAFACADGSVRVYTGLMDIMDDQEILGVIGHEMGHVAHHDSRNSFKQALMNEALSDALASTSTKVAALTDSQLGTISNALVSSKYSRKAEEKADDFGYDFLKSYGRDPRAMVYAFRKLEQLQQASGAQTSVINQLFSSHPDVAKRITRMTKKCKKDGYPIQ